MNEFENSSEPGEAPPVMLPARRLPDGSTRAYVRFAALGDSATYGIGDYANGKWRGWAALLAKAVSEQHDVSFCNLAKVGATIDGVFCDQLDEAVAHRPHLASLIVGINDTLRSGWDPELARLQLVATALELASQQTLLLTLRFHDHAEVLPLPRPLRRRLSERIEALNDIYGEIYTRFGGVQVDLRSSEAPLQREFWAIDRLHPSERGHRWLAREFAIRLTESGLGFEAPGEECTGYAPTRKDNARWLISQGGPWLGRRAKDFGPWAARGAVQHLRPHHA